MGRRRIVRAARRLFACRRPVDPAGRQPLWPGRHPVLLFVAGGDAAPRPALHRGGRGGGRASGRALEPRCVDEPARLGPGRGGRHRRSRQRAAHRGRGVARGLRAARLLAPVLDAAGRRALRAVARGGAREPRIHAGNRAAAARRVAGRGASRGADDARSPGSRAGLAGAGPGTRGQSGPPAGRAGAPVPARPGHARGRDRAGAADGLRQRGRPAPGARHRPAARTRHPRLARRRARAGRPPAPDRERAPERCRRRGRLRGGGRDRPRRAGADPAERSRPRRRRARRRGARVHGGPVGGGRPGLRDRAGPGMVARRPDPRPQRGTRCRRRRPRTPAGEPGDRRGWRWRRSRSRWSS